MTIIIDNLEGDNVDATKFTAKLSYETSLNEIFNTFKFDLPYEFYEKNKIKVFSRVYATSGNDFNFIGIVINTGINNLERVTLECVSDSWYLSTYEELIKVKNFRADKVIKQVISGYDSSFKVETIPLMESISKIYNSNSIMDIVDDVLKQNESGNGKKLYRTFENNTLTIFDTPTAYKLNFEYAVSKLKLSYNGEDVKTKVKVFTKEKKKISVESIQTNPNMIKKVGVIQKVYSIDAKDKAEADLRARNLLKIYGSVKRTGSFTIFGDYKARVGMSVKVEGFDYIISGLKHTIEDEIHLMGVAIVRYEKEG